MKRLVSISTEYITKQAKTLTAQDIGIANYILNYNGDNQEVLALKKAFLIELGLRPTKEV